MRLAIAVGLGLAVAVSALQYVVASIAHHYSPGFRSESSDAAERAGVLVLRPTIVDSVVPLRTGDIEVVDIWYEHQTRIRYRALFWRRVERTGEIRVVARVRVPALAEPHGALTYTAPGLTPDTVPFTIRAGTREVAEFARSAVTAVHDTLTLGWSAP